MFSQHHTRTRGAPTRTRVMLRCRAGCLLGVQPAASRKKPAHSKGESLGIRRRRARCELFTTSARYTCIVEHMHGPCADTAASSKKAPERPGEATERVALQRGGLQALSSLSCAAGGGGGGGGGPRQPLRNPTIAKPLKTGNLQNRFMSFRTSNPPASGTD